MSDRPPRSSVAGGFLIALGLIAGGVIGMTRGNAVQWLLIGAVAGAAAALAIWLIDRRR